MVVLFFLCKCVPVLTLDVRHIAEDPKYVGRLINLAKSGYFSAVGLLSFLQKWADPASCFYACRSHCSNWVQLGTLWINSERPVD